MMHRIIGLASALRSDRRGASALEFAFAAPMLILVLVGTEEVGRAIWVQGVLQYASEKAARCGAVAPAGCTTTANVTSFAATQANGVALSSSNFTATPTAACGYHVSASYSFVSLVPALIPYNIVLIASSCYPA